MFSASLFERKPGTKTLQCCIYSVNVVRLILPEEES